MHDYAMILRPRDSMALGYDGEDLFVLELTAWRVLRRWRLGAALAREVWGWEDPPRDTAHATRRRAVFDRLVNAGLRDVFEVIRIDASVRSRARMITSFVGASESHVPLPTWHRRALAKFAVEHQEYVLWGFTPQLEAVGSLRRVSFVAVRPPVVLDTIYVIAASGVPHRDLAHFEDEATAAGVTRLYVDDDGKTLRVGPMLVGDGLGSWTKPPDEAIGPNPLDPHPLLQNLMEREMILACPRIARATVGEMSIAKGRVFELDWGTLSARERRLSVGS